MPLAPAPSESATTTAVTLPETPVRPTAPIIRAVVRAVETPRLPPPQIVSVALSEVGVTTNDLIRFSGRALPNQEIVVYIHSDQALIYRAKANSAGVWAVEHSQKITELSSGRHTVYAVGLDLANGVKSRPSGVMTFDITKNNLVNLYNQLSLKTTVIAIGTLLLVMVWLYRIKYIEKRNSARRYV